MGEIALFLHYYGQDLNLISTDAAKLTVAMWVQQHAREIASALVHHFLTEPTWQPASTAGAERQFQTYFQKHIQSAVISPGADASDSHEGSLSRTSLQQLERLDGFTLDDVKEFLNSSEAFERFVSFLARSIRWDASKAIADELNADLQSPPPESSDFKFHISWDLALFVREELLPEILQDSDKRDRQKEYEYTFVVSGGGEAFSATMLQSYLRWLVPDTADRVLNLPGMHLFDKFGMQDLHRSYISDISHIQL